MRNRRKPDPRQELKYAILTAITISLFLIIAIYGKNPIGFALKAIPIDNLGFVSDSNENPTLIAELPTLSPTEIPNQPPVTPTPEQTATVTPPPTANVATANTQVTATTYFYAGSLLASKSSDDPTTTTFYIQDHLGSNREVLNGEVGIQNNEFYPFGETKSTSGTSSNNYKYTGKELDAETGLYYYGARYYSPETGRFIQADSVWGSLKDPLSLNRYAYVDNNPLKLVDPSGNSATGSSLGGCNRGNACSADDAPDHQGDSSAADSHNTLMNIKTTSQEDEEQYTRDASNTVNTAIHELSHAVVGTVLGNKVVGMSITPEGNTLGSTVFSSSVNTATRVAPYVANAVISLSSSDVVSKLTGGSKLNLAEGKGFSVGINFKAKGASGLNFAVDNLLAPAYQTDITQMNPKARNIASTLISAAGVLAVEKTIYNIGSAIKNKRDFYVGVSIRANIN